MENLEILHVDSLYEQISTFMIIVHMIFLLGMSVYFIVLNNKKKNAFYRTITITIAFTMFMSILNLMLFGKVLNDVNSLNQSFGMVTQELESSYLSYIDNTYKFHIVVISMSTLMLFALKSAYRNNVLMYRILLVVVILIFASAMFYFSRQEIADYSAVFSPY